MGSLQIALDHLGALSVAGVTSYPLDQTPDALVRAQLPALVILPEWGGESPGWEPNPFAAAAGTLTVRLMHALLVAPVAGGLGLRSGLPALCAALDAYAQALAADPLLGGALAEVLRFTVRIGVVRYAGIDYHGALLAHHWVLRLESA